MAENPWMKQMLANKNKTGESSNNTKPEVVSTPPWIKNNSNIPNSTPAINNIMKGNPSETNNNTPNLAPWAKNNVVTTPPVNTNQTNSTVTTPPWMKNTANQEPVPTAPWASKTVTNPPNVPTQNIPNQVNKAPWANKIGKTEQNSTSSPQAPWANKNNNSPSSTTSIVQENVTPPSTAPWANKNPSPVTNTSTTPWANKNTSTLGQNAGNPPPTAPWANKNSTPLANSYKIKQAEQIQKQKLQLAEKMRQQQQEQKENKRLQKLKREKEQQEQDIKRELKMMKQEQMFSVQRQRQEKQNQEKEKRLRQEKERLKRQQQMRIEREKIQLEKRLKREQQQKQRQLKLQEDKQRNDDRQQQKLPKQVKSKQKRALKHKTKEIPFENSKISHISSIKAVENNEFSELEPSQQQNQFHKWIRLINQDTSDSDYRAKINNQKAIIQLQLGFKKECESQIVGLMEKKKVTNRKRKVIFSNNLQIKYGLCQGKKGQNGLQFCNEETQQLRDIFLHYEALKKCIVTLLKKKINIHLRVPLVNLSEYKGVTFLVEYICEELIDIIEIDINLFQEIANEVLILEKELELNYDDRNESLQPLTKQQLMVKKVSICREEYYILYIKNPKKMIKNSKQQQSASKIAKSHIQNLTYIKILQFLTTQPSLLPFYLPAMTINKSIMEVYEKMATSTMKNLVKDIFLANSINIVYSSCQGQVNQEMFFNLLMQGNKEIWQMIALTGYPDKQTPSPIALTYLQKISSIKFNFTKQFYSKKGKDRVKSVNPKIYIQKNDFQLLEFTKNIQKYITEDKAELVEQSMSLNRQIKEQIEKFDPSNINFLQLKSQVSYLLYKRRQDEALVALDSFKQCLNEYDIENIPVALLYLKVFISTDQEVKMLKKLSELLQVLEFYFKEQTIVHSFIYIIVGSYYSKKKNEDETEKQSKVKTFYEHALNIALKLFGQKAQEVAQVYLSRANAFFCIKKYDLFHKDMSLAVKIYKAHSKSGSRIAECNYLLGKVACIEGNLTQGIQSLESASNMLLKMESYIQCLNINFQMLEFLENNQTKLELKLQQIIEICFTFKSVWAFKRIITIILDRQLNCYTSLTIQNLEDLFNRQEDDRTNQEILIDLEEEIKGFTNFIEIVRWSLSILAAKLVTRRQITTDYEKAFNIMSEIYHFYTKQSKNMPFDLKQSQLL